MSAILEYKCPNCGGAIVFDSKSQQFKCESCDSIFTQEQLQQYDEALKAAQAESSYQWEQPSANEELGGMVSYSCQSCGAQIVTDPTTAASECPYCNSPIIMTGQVVGMNKPDFVIPFKIDKNKAKQMLLDFYKGKRLLPDTFSKGNKVREIKGVYVPFWLFDSTVNANIMYDTSRTRIWSDRDYNYTEVSHYSVSRFGSIAFSKIPVDGSSKMDDAYMDSIEPFDYSAITDFNAAYLSGFLADKYDVSAEDCFPRANERLRESTEAKFSETVIGYDTVVPKHANIKSVDGKCHYALLPVWMLNTKWGDKTYTFAVNGQTGKIVGELPVDKKKAFKWFAIIASVIVAVGQIAVFLL